MTKGADNCAAFDALLVEYAYGELEGDVRLQLESHLQGCEACRTALEAMGATRRAMRVLAPVPAPEAGLESLLGYARQAAARSSAAPARSRWRWLVPAMSAGSLGLALAVVLATGRSPGEDVLPAAAPAAQARLRAEERARPAALDELALAQPAAPTPVAPVAPVAVAKDMAAAEAGKSLGLVVVDKLAEPAADCLAAIADEPEKKTAGFAAAKPSRSAAAREQRDGVAATPAQEPSLSSFASGAASLSPPPPPAPAPAERPLGGGGLAKPAAPASKMAADEDWRAETTLAKGEAASDDFEAQAEAAPRKSKMAARAATRAAEEEAGYAAASGLEEALANARTASARGDFGLAASILARGLAENPGDARTADALLELALAYERSGNPGRAEEAYARFLARYPEDSRAGPAAASRARLRQQATRARAASEAADQVQPAAAAPSGPQPLPAEP